MSKHIRVVSVSSDDLIEYCADSNNRIDPVHLIGKLPDGLLPLEDSLFVKIWDEHNSVMYRYVTFLSRTYPVEDGKVKFGVKRLKLDGMSMIVGVKVEFHDLDSMIDPVD